MNLDHMLAQLRGTLAADVPHPDSFSQEAPRCVQRGCNRPASIKDNGEYAKSCKPCRIRRAKSCKRRRKALIAQGGCRRCAYRPRLQGDFLCARCRQDRHAERAQKRQDAIDAAAIDEFAAKPEKAHRASNLDRGVSPERKAGAGGDCGVLVTAARPRSEAERDMAVVADEREVASPILIPHLRARPMVGFLGVEPSLAVGHLLISEMHQFFQNLGSAFDLSVGDFTIDFRVSQDVPNGEGKGHSIWTSPTIAVVPRIVRVSVLAEQLLQSLPGLIGGVYLALNLKDAVVLKKLSEPMKNWRFAVYRSSNGE